MKIHLIANDGSPIGVIPPRLHGEGVGGAELAMMSLMEVFAKRGHKVTVYNDPMTPGEYDGVAYRPLADFVTEHPRDVLIIFRSPNARVNHRRIPKNQRVIWWSCDQQTVGDFAELANLVDFAVTISPYHTEYHLRRYGINPKKIGHIDIGVRTWEYDMVEAKKDPKQLLFCSIPDRGLKVLHAAWPLIKEAVPDTKLVITSDYTLWGAPQPGNQQHRLDWMNHDGIDFRGKVSRAELVKLQCQSQIQSYPCTYEELFCISTAECAVAGAYPITSEVGALRTTNEFGVAIPGNPTNPDWVKVFVSRIVGALSDEALPDKQAFIMKNARQRFGFDTVAARWEELFERGVLS